jgi:hypothetical protein
MGGIILEWILEEQGARMWIEFIWLIMGFKAGGLSMVITRNLKVPNKKDV